MLIECIHVVCFESKGSGLLGGTAGESNYGQVRWHCALEVINLLVNLNKTQFTMLLNTTNHSMVFHFFFVKVNNYTKTLRCNIYILNEKFCI